MSRAESASGPITASEPSAAGVQRQQVALVAQQHRGPLGGDPGHLAVGRVGEHLAGAVLVDVRVVEQAQAHLRLEDAPHARVERLRRRPRPASQRLGQVGVGGVGDGHLHVHPGVDARGRAASVRSAAKPWVSRLRTALASLTTKPVEAPGVAQHLGEQPPVAGRPGCR